VAQVPAISLIFRDILFSRTETGKEPRDTLVPCPNSVNHPLFPLFVFLAIPESHPPMEDDFRELLYDSDGNLSFHPARADELSDRLFLIVSELGRLEDRQRSLEIVIVSRLKSRGIEDSKGGLIMLELSIKWRIELISGLTRKSLRELFNELILCRFK